jgi:ABC-type transport system involved in multi-copper enzyme maturation permease subunit
MGVVFAIIGVTFREARRRRLLAAGLLVGGAFVLLYALGLLLILSNAPCGRPAKPCNTPFQQAQLRLALNMLTIAGLYVSNFLALIAAVLLPVDTVSGEIASGVTQTLASKPIRRGEIVFGKWLGYWLLLLIYVAVTAGGVVTAMWTVTAAVLGGTGFVPAGAERGLPLMMLAATVMLTISIAGGTRFSTITNGMVAFGILGLGFLGGWVEQFGVLLAESPAGKQAVRNIGTIVSLGTPADALWRLAAYDMIPPLLRDVAFTPFTSVFPPSAAMIPWAFLYIIVVFGVGLRQFERRAL